MRPWHRITLVSSDGLKLAIHCQYLRRTIEPGRAEPFVMVCQHPVRDGSECIGPFLEDLGTGCGLWEAHPRSHLIPLPEPERWQRRRRAGFDYRPSYSDGWP